MTDTYAKYLLLIAVTIIGAVIAGIVLMARSHRVKAPAVKSKPVDFGSVSVFFDKAGNASIIPYVADLFGEGKATADVTYLQQPYSSEALGAAIRSALISCRNAKPGGSAVLMAKLQSQSWKAFSEGKTNLSIYFREGYGIVFNTTVRTSEGAYIFNTRGIEHYIPADAGDIDIGSTSLELLKRCRS